VPHGGCGWPAAIKHVDPLIEASLQRKSSNGASALVPTLLLEILFIPHMGQYMDAWPPALLQVDRLAEWSRNECGAKSEEQVLRNVAAAGTTPSFWSSMPSRP
jgi:hypothetical protein